MDEIGLGQVSHQVSSFSPTKHCSHIVLYSSVTAFLKYEIALTR